MLRSRCAHGVYRIKPLKANAAGFSLVELLIGLALGTWLISSVAITAQRLWLMAHWSADEVELAERGDFALRHLSLALLHAGPITEANTDLSPCEAPEVTPVSSFQCQTDAGFIEKDGLGIRVVGQGELTCLPSQNLVKSSPLLIVEATHSCHWPACDAGFLSSNGSQGLQCTSDSTTFRLSPGSNRWEDCREDCVSVGAVKHWSRRLYYLRDFAWSEGDGRGALMMKAWRLEDGRFGRGEVVVPGVGDWVLAPIKLPSDPEGSHLLAGLDISLTLLGARAGVDAPLTGAEVKMPHSHRAAQRGYPALLEGSSQRMILRTLVLSRHLRIPELRGQTAMVAE